MKILTVLLLFHLFSYFAVADVYQEALEVHCSVVSSIDIESLASHTSFNTEEQRVVLCDAFSELSKRYIQTSVKSFEPVFVENLEMCMNLVNHADADVWSLNSILKKCFAAFKDGHMFSVASRSSFVFLPFSVAEVDQKFYISSIGYTVCGDSDFQVGDELLSMDGESITSIKNRLSAYVASSTASAVSGLTQKFVTDRDFAIPESGDVELKILRDSNAISLQKKWLYYPNQVGKDNKLRLTKRGFRPCEHTSGFHKKGYFNSDSLYPSSRSVVFSESPSGNDEFLVIGRQEINAERVCYLKLDKFNFDTVYTSGKKIDIWAVLKGFVETCEADHVPMLLDLRKNPGGDMGNMANLVQLFANSELVDIVNSFFVNKMKSDKSADQLCDGSAPLSFDDEPHLNKLEMFFCNMFDLKERRSEGYLGRIYVLTGAECMSACDYSVAFLDVLENTKIIGENTQSAMLITNTAPPAFDLRKPYLIHIFNMAPYFMVGKLEETDRDHYVLCADDGGVCYRQLEGVEITPHENYVLSYEDIVSQPAGAGWRAKIAEVMKTDLLKQVP